MSVMESVFVSVWWLPHAGTVEARVWACREDGTSRVAFLSWVWEWRTSGVEKSAHTHFCLSSPLCLQGASLSWICLPPPAWTQVNTRKYTHTWINGCINMTLTYLHGWNSEVYLTCLGQRCQCFWTDPCSFASQELCAPPSYWCISSPAGPEPPSCSSTSGKGRISHLGKCRSKNKRTT